MSKVDEDTRTEAEFDTSEEVTSPIEHLKSLFSTALLVLSVCVVMAAIFSEQTAAKDFGIPPIVAFIVFWACIVWLAMIEGGQGCLVGLQPANKAKYAKSHPISLQCTTLAHDGNNMERFIVGRQFLVVLLIFTINQMGSAIADAGVLGFGSALNAIFLANGIAMILTTINIGQLIAQVNAADCMLDFINNKFMLFSTYVSLGIEVSGLLHSVYLVQYIFAACSGKPIESNEPDRTAIQEFFFWGRVLISCGALGFALSVTFDSLFAGVTTFWDGVPSGVVVAIFAVLLCFVGIMEGMQIAAFAVVKLPEASYKDTHKLAHANCTLLFKGTNLGRFLIGRQVCVTCVMFVAARVVSIDSANPDIEGGRTSFGVSAELQEFFNTGLLGALVTTIIGSLMWRIIASTLPLLFMSNPVIFVIIKLCLGLESTGICAVSWVVARFQKSLMGYQADEVYLNVDDVELNAI